LTNKRNSDELVIFNGGSNTGFVARAGGDWGSIDNAAIWSGSIDTEGATKVGERTENRIITLPITVVGEDTSQSVSDRWQELANKVTEIREYKGTVRFRPSTATYGVTFEIEHVQLTGNYWGKTNELGGYREVNLVLTCKPYALMDPMDISDDFSVDTFGTAGKYNNGGCDWTADAGALTNVTAGSYMLDAAANLSTENRFIHTGAAHDVGDVQVTASYAPGATISSFKGGVILKRIDASNYLEVYIDDNGANSRLRIDKIVAGARTNLASTNLASRISNGSYFTIIGRIENNVIYADHWTTVVQEIYTPTTTTSWTMTAAEATTFGLDVSGRCGITFTPQHTDAKSKLYIQESYVYTKIAGYPDDIRLGGEIPGNTDALIDLSFSAKSGAGSGYDCYMMFGWNNRPKKHNYILNSSLTQSMEGYSVGAVAGVISAATSISSTFTAGTGYTGQMCGEVVCPATTDTGASYQIFRRFKKGVTYTAKCYLRSAAHTTNARIKLGVSGDLSTETAVPLSTTWTLHTVTWTPTTDYYRAYFVAGIAAATATTFRIDQVEVFEGTSVEYYNQNTPIFYDTITDGAYPAFGIIDAGDGTADASAYGGYRTAYSASGTTKSFRVSPALIDDSSDTGETNLVGVWARVYIPSTSTNPILKAYIRPPDGYQTSYTLEYGTTGKSLVVPSASVFRQVYLGAIPVSAYGGDVNLIIEATYGVASPELDCLYLVPVDKYVQSMGGVSSTAAQKFCFTLGQARHTVRSDGRGYSESQRAYPFYSYDEYYPRRYASPGLIGSTIKGRGDMNVLVAPMSTPIDQSNSTGGADSVPLLGVFRAKVQPRVLMVGA